MTKVTQVTEVNELIKYWPRLLSLVKKETPLVNAESYLQTLLTCLSNGAVFVVRGDRGLSGICCVEQQTATILSLRSIPNDKGTGIARECIAAIKDWGNDCGYDTLEVSTERLSGSSFRYFEKSLGFHRKFVTFTLPLNQ